MKSGRLSAELGRTIAHMQRDREDADYATGAVFTATEGAQAIDDAVRFLESVRALLP